MEAQLGSGVVLEFTPAFVSKADILYLEEGIGITSEGASPFIISKLVYSKILG